MPVFLIIYLLVPAKARNPVIFIGSLIFYGLGEPVYVFLMLLAIFVSYAAALGIERCRSAGAGRGSEKAGVGSGVAEASAAGAESAESASTADAIEPGSESAEISHAEAESTEASERGAENPKAETPVAENPKAEKTKAEDLVAENPKAENPKAEASVAENLKAENPKAEAPVAENLKAGKPKAKTSEAEKTKADKTEATEPVAEKPVAAKTGSKSAPAAVDEPKRRIMAGGLLALCVVFNLGLLLYFKYGAFFVSCFCSLSGRESAYENPALPLGISFYTFQILSYVVDVYRGTIAAEKSFVDLGAYISMFPQLIAGPIVIYQDIRETLKNAAGRITPDGFARGAEIFTIGLGSKVLLANRFGQLWDTMAEMGYGNISMGTSWIGALAYTFQIYFDFNGYSLMAIGLGSMLGFEIPRNFNRPYTASSVTSFWKRWHMTLTSFFRTYLYIPLGGNRKGKKRTYLNMLIVWCITGFWHGAAWNFIFWGLYYFIFQAAERALFGDENSAANRWIRGIKSKLIGGTKYRVLRFGRRSAAHIYTMAVVITGWVIFAAPSLGEAFTYIGRMFSFFTGNTDGLKIASLGPVMYVWLLAGALFSTQLPSKVYSLIREKTVSAFVLLFIFWFSVVQLSDGVYNPFLYFRF